MRFALLLLASALFLRAQDDKKEVLSVIDKLFNGMSTADATAIASTMTPDAKLVADNDNKLAAPRTRDDFAQRIGSNNNHLLERIWNPTVLIRGRIAMVWAEYDLHVAGKFNHCGIDAFTLLKTDEGWKISGIQYTSETQNCKPSPLGPPQP
jgi:hypothetical protein